MFIDAMLSGKLVCTKLQAKLTQPLDTVAAANLLASWDRGGQHHHIARIQQLADQSRGELIGPTAPNRLYTNAEYTVWMRLYLGLQMPSLPATPTTVCSCSYAAAAISTDQYSQHVSNCPSLGQAGRHAAVKKFFVKLAMETGAMGVQEEPIVGQSNGKVLRSDILIPNHRDGKDYYLDPTIINTLSTSHLKSNSSRAPGAAMATVQNAKNAKYKALIEDPTGPDGVFVPLAMTSLGQFSELTKQHITESASTIMARRPKGSPPVLARLCNDLQFTIRRSTARMVLKAMQLTHHIATSTSHTPQPVYDPSSHVHDASLLSYTNTPPSPNHTFHHIVAFDGSSGGLALDHG
jgi:hypothetical protein